MLEIYVNEPVEPEGMSRLTNTDGVDAWIVVFGNYPATVHANPHEAGDFISEISHEGVDINKAQIHKVRLSLRELVRAQLIMGNFVEVQSDEQPFGRTEE